MKKPLLISLAVFSLALLPLSGCTKKPSPEEITKLQEARAAADAAEKKLGDLRNERVQLESQLEAKKEELRKAEEERDAIKAKLGN